MKLPFSWTWNQILIGLLVVLVGGIFYVFSNNGTYNGATFPTALKDIVTRVSVVGSVRPATSVELTFEMSGRVSKIPVSVGTRVKAGQPIAFLESGLKLAKVREYEARVALKSAELNEAKRGTRSEEIQVSEAEYESARLSSIDSRTTLLNAVRDAYTYADDTVRNKVDQFMNNPRSSSPSISVLIASDPNSLIANGRVKVENVLTTWKTSLETLEASSDLIDASQIADRALSDIASFLDTVSLTINGATVNTRTTQATLDSYRADVLAGRTNVNSARGNVSSAVEALRSADASLSVAEGKLSLKLAGETSEAILAKEASLMEVEALLSGAESELTKTVLRAPFDGIVTLLPVEVGEAIDATSPVVSLISSTPLQVEVYIPEADLPKVAVGDGGVVTLDAYGNEVSFPAKISRIDPSETIRGGVVTYKTTIVFLGLDERVRPGMTASVILEKKVRTGVLAVPVGAVTRKNGEAFVSVVKSDRTLEQKRVDVGLQSYDGIVEIVTGLEKGEVVALSANAK